MAKRAVEGEESLLPEHEAMSARLAEMTGEFKTSQTAGAQESHASSLPESSAGTTASKAGVQNLRVDVGKLDRMLNLTVEFAIAQGRQRRILEDRFGEGANGREVLEAHHGLEALFLEQQALKMRIRMDPARPPLHPFARSGRDSARQSVKIARRPARG